MLQPQAVHDRKSNGHDRNENKEDEQISAHRVAGLRMTRRQIKRGSKLLYPAMVTNAAFRHLKATGDGAEKCLRSIQEQLYGV
jgi:hypothetical protein